MSVQGDLAEQNESPLQVNECVVRNRHESCTTCTEKSEARLKELNSTLLKTNEIRKSSRDKHLTPKMQELKAQELVQRESKFISAYNSWKIHVREVRLKLKQECSESDLCDMMDGVEKKESELKGLYDSMRLQAVPSQEIRRKIDACSAVTADLIKIMNVRLVEDGMEFDAEAEKARLRVLLDCEYARSIYGSTVSRATVFSNHSKPSSESASISARRAETAALLAAKKAEMEMEADIDAQRQRLKKLENRRDIEVMEARLRVYTEEELRVRSQQYGSACSDVSNASPLVPNTSSLSPQVTKGEVSVVQALQESMALSRLPVPEPFVFFGDPLKFIEWSTTFKALIERRCLNSADRLFYLQKYIDGEARSVLKGSFYRKDEQAYQQAWEKLNARYGHSFVAQRAFREKLNRWPKIGASEYVKLREFSDFLQSCSDAMPHIKGLQVLNDCEENQKILVKLPNWVTSRWNRYVTKQLDQDKDYPSFSEFASFVSKEARIACNPVSSLYALKICEEKPFKEIKRLRVNRLATTVNDLDAACAMGNTSNIIDRKTKESSNLKSTLVINGGDEEPYAIKTDLGWSIIGGTPNGVNSKDVTSICHRISVRELPLVTPAAVRALELDLVDSREDQDYLRFLWWLNGDLNTEPREYRMKVHLFGASSSPGCANYGLKYLASIERKLVEEAQARCAKGKLHLHKFVSNNRKVLASISESDRAVEVENVDFHNDYLPVKNVLGVRKITRRLEGGEEMETDNGVTILTDAV
ncbi:uncharacterized protein LOC127934956 [Carassius gibelio]|uniref:uncharacterized protein LOC127934956 n=1 Tax=Carassius gibelio TaxID=101364 RepID=UPI002278277E|nr:uncharacterized protein LOC127934956 [Carassius gibelio]